MTPIILVVYAIIYGGTYVQTEILFDLPQCHLQGNELVLSLLEHEQIKDPQYTCVLVNNLTGKES